MQTTGHCGPSYCPAAQLAAFGVGGVALHGTAVQLSGVLDSHLPWRLQVYVAALPV